MHASIPGSAELMPDTQRNKNYSELSQKPVAYLPSGNLNSKACNAQTQLDNTVEAILLLDGVSEQQLDRAGMCDLTKT